MTLEDLGCSEIGDFDVHLTVEENVFRLEIPVDHTAFMHVVYRV